MIYTIFEYKPDNFYPFSINHATFEIRAGAFSILDRMEHKLNSDDQIILIVRDAIEGLVSERYPHLTVNPDIIPPSKLFCLDKEVGEIKEETSLSNFRTKDWINIEESYLWNHLGSLAFSYDKQKFNMKIQGDCHSSCIMLNKADIHISDSAIVSAGVILDATDGPIIIDDDAFIDIGALIKGNTYIGKSSVINPGAKLRGEISIGPYCKIGGEIECSTFHGYSNKQHDGYIGHSYVGEWVNLGANTNNSDLKNNYSSVKFKIGDNDIDTDEMFIGCMIGDYAKTGISTMLNTGTYIGLGANVFGGEFQNKFIPSFSWGRDDITEADKFLSTLKIVKERRGKLVTKSEISLIKILRDSNKSKKF